MHSRFRIGSKLFFIVCAITATIIMSSTVSRVTTNAFQKHVIGGGRQCRRQTHPVVVQHRGISTATVRTSTTITTKRSPQTLPRVGGFLTATFAAGSAGILRGGGGNSNGTSNTSLFSTVTATASSSVLSSSLSTNMTACQDEEENDHDERDVDDNGGGGGGHDAEASTIDASAAESDELDVKTPPFDESVLSYDHYNGVTLHLGDYVKWIQSHPTAEPDMSKFGSDLETALDFWRAEGRKGIWIHAPLPTSSYIPICVQAGFHFQQIKRGNTSVNGTYGGDDDDDNNEDASNLHSAANNTLILSQWLPDTPSKLPLGPTHQCGVGVVVLNPRDPSQMLVVQEKSGPAAAFNLWKMPTGLTDPSEDIHEAAVRELLEETGLDAKFEGIVCFRQAHRPGGATSDLFFVCHMKLIQDGDDDAEVIWKPQEDEIAAIKWMPVQEFCDQDRWQGSPLYTTLNESILKLSKSVVSSTRRASDNDNEEQTTTSPQHHRHLPLIDHHQLDVGFGRSFGGTNALFMPSAGINRAKDHGSSDWVTRSYGSTTDQALKSDDGVIGESSTTSIAGMIDFLTMARGLKTTPRTGWVRQEAGPNIESVADHSWRITLMSMISSSVLSSRKAGPAYDVNRCIKMALVHDLAEAVVGDITPHCGVTDQDKHAQELAAITEMTRKLCVDATTGVESQLASPNVELVGDEILELWKEYEEGVTPESKLVKDMDKLEMTLQALEYENDGQNGKSLDGFFDGTRGKWRTDIGKAWGEEIETRRKKE